MRLMRCFSLRSHAVHGSIYTAVASYALSSPKAQDGKRCYMVYLHTEGPATIWEVTNARCDYKFIRDMEEEIMETSM